MIKDESENTQIQTGKIPEEIAVQLAYIKSKLTRGDVNKIVRRLRKGRSRGISRCTVSISLNGKCRTTDAGIRIIRAWNTIYPELASNTHDTQTLLKTA